MKEKKNSPFKFLPIAMAAVSIGSSIFGAVSANRKQKEAEKKEKEARERMEAQKEIYKNLDTSNPFANLQNRFVDMENTMEDLTVNQQQAQFERDSFQQTQANIMGNFREAAGGSGIAALAQSLAQQGQVAAQKQSASIGAQEAQNQKLGAQEASKLQEMNLRGASNLDNLIAQGDRQTQKMEMGKQATMLGMDQQETAAYMQQAQAAEEAKWGAISGGVSNLMNIGVSQLGGTTQ
tara:strand:- start:4044 stop:4751 length:708 start_codon:yes stop_codon:yes gene_type:complete